MPRRIWKFRVTAWVAVLACASIACGGGAEPAQENSRQAGHGGPLDDDFRGCPDGIPSVAPGLGASGERVRVRVLEALPAEPERYLNRWTVEVGALDGTPAADAEIVRGETFMPVHGHDGRVQPRMTVLADPARIVVDRLNFTMRGPWEVRLWLRSESLEERVVFEVCVAK